MLRSTLKRQSNGIDLWSYYNGYGEIFAIQAHHGDITSVTCLDGMIGSNKIKQMTVEFKNDNPGYSFQALFLLNTKCRNH